MIDAAMEAAHRRAIAKTGELVTVQRISGAAPRTVTFSATVMANVQSYSPDSQSPSKAGYGGSAPGGISQDDRQVILMERDLAAQRFPVPVRKNDKIVLQNGEKLNVIRVDGHKRNIAGAVELMAAGVA